MNHFHIFQCHEAQWDMSSFLSKIPLCKKNKNTYTHVYTYIYEYKTIQYISHTPLETFNDCVDVRC